MARRGGAADDPARLARRLIRSVGRASLATIGDDGRPLATLVLAACGQDGAPLLLLSGLAAHTRNIANDPRVSLLFATEGPGEGALARPRVSVGGRAGRHDDKAARARFLARHPAASAWAALPDFVLWRIVPDAGHLVAGFARTHQLPGAALLADTAAAVRMQEAEVDILAHMNADHREAIALYATILAGARGGGWRITGIDPEGCDLRRPSRGREAPDSHLVRIDFPQPVDGPDAARTMLVALARTARRRAQA